jgi:hypothetical protein
MKTLKITCYRTGPEITGRLSTSINIDGKELLGVNSFSFQQKGDEANFVLETDLMHFAIREAVADVADDHNISPPG